MLTVIVRENTPGALLVELEAGRVDMVVGRLTAPTDEYAIRRTLYRESVELVACVDHPLTPQSEVTLAELAEYPWILPGIETALRQELENFFAHNGIPLPSNRVEATSYLTVRQLLVETDMIAVLPGLIARGDSRLSMLPLSLEAIGHSVGLTLSAGRRLSPSGEALVTSLHRIAADMASGGF